MTAPERALAQTELEIARRSARRITAFLKRPDLSPAVVEMAREQRDEFLREVHIIEAALQIDAHVNATALVAFAFSMPMRYLRGQQVAR